MFADQQPFTQREGEKWGAAVPALLWAVLGVIVVWGFFSTNVVDTIAAVAILPFFWVLLWMPGEPPVLLIACVLQWLQVSLPVFYSNLQGATLESAYSIPRIELAFWLGLVGVVVLAAGMRVAVWRKSRSRAREAEVDAVRLHSDRTFIAWLVSFAVVSGSGVAASAIPGLRQIFVNFQAIELAMYFLLAYAILVRQKHYLLLGLATGIEVASGLIQFFSGFRSVLLILLIAALTTRARFTMHRRILFACLLLILAALTLVWSAIKSDYRSFLNQGSGQQEVSVPIAERFDALKDLSAGLSRDDLNDAVEQTIGRIGYLEYFAWTLTVVPDQVPFENGNLWKEAIESVLRPRLFFPDKGVLDDSYRTRKYTGLNVAGPEEGASIGIGYMAESYIDFGPYLMFLPVFIIGLGYGAIYRYFVFFTHNRALGVSLAVGILYIAHQGFAMAEAKLLGGNILSFLVLFGFAKVLGKPLMSWLSEPRLEAAHVMRAADMGHSG